MATRVARRAALRVPVDGCACIAFPVRSATLSVDGYACEASASDSDVADTLWTDDERAVRRFLREHTEADHVRVVAHTTERQLRGTRTVFVCTESVAYDLRRVRYSVNT